MKIRIWVFLLGLVSLISCRQMLDNYWDRKEQENYTSTYMGVYKGNYSGDETGSLMFEVAKNGYISVTKTSQFNTENGPISGIVRDDGALQSVILGSGFTLYGNLHTKSGIWKRGDWEGTWSVTKE